MKGSKFKPMKGRLSRRANDWNEKYVSSGAKGTLIKSVLQSLMTYAMGVFKFPAGVTDDFSKIIRDFWWGMRKIKGRCIGCPGRR
jgi:hypothetical protein